MSDIVKIQFRQELIADFFAGVFGKSHKGVIKISRQHDIGKLIYSLIKYSEFALPEFVKSYDNYTVVDISLPLCTLSTAQSYYLYLTKEDQLRINDYVTAFFNQEIRAFLIMGQEMNIQQKDIIEMFMAQYKLDQDKHAGLVKKDYRWRMNVKKKIHEMAKTYGI